MFQNAPPQIQNSPPINSTLAFNNNLTKTKRKTIDEKMDMPCSIGLEEVENYLDNFDGNNNFF